MRWSADSTVKAGVGLALLILLAIGFVSYRTLTEFVRSVEEVDRTHSIIERLEAVLSRIADAESSQRGYLLTGDETYLEPFTIHSEEIHTELRELGMLIAEDTAQQERLSTLESLVIRRLHLMEGILETRHLEGFLAAQKAEAAGQGKELMDEIRAQVAEMSSEERQKLALRRRTVRSHAQRALTIGFIGTVMAFALMLGAGFILRRDARQRRRTEAALQVANEQLQAGLAELESRGRELALLSELGDLLQGCQQMEEAHRVVAQSVGKLFPAEAGALGVLNLSRNHIEVVGVWGGSYQGEKVFPPDNCWALRRGRLHRVEDPASAQNCPHIPSDLVRGYLCVPLVAQGEALGILHLQGNPELPRQPAALRAQAAEYKQRLASTVGEQIAMALANLRLRDTLRQQSIRDPLTGLFNRRYLEESLDRELLRAARSRKTLAVLMLDLDHFKRFNDTFGHEAGDTLLRSLGELLCKRIRGEDIACRFGGEEFTLILPEASLAAAAKRAEDIREAMRGLELRFRGQPLGRVTVSLGLAVYPEHGETAEELLRAADAALYQAKSAGRDRVVTASVPPSESTARPS